MKTYITLTLLLLCCYSCSLTNEKSTIGQVHTKMRYHKNGFKYNLKGPVKEVKRSVWKVAGDTSSFTILEMDSTMTAQGRSLQRFNKKGFIICEVEGHRYSTYGPRQSRNISTFYYRSSDIIDSISVSVFKTKTSYSTENLLDIVEARYYTTRRFRDDTLFYVSHIFDEIHQDTTLINFDDTSITYNPRMDEEKQPDTTCYLKCEDGKYRLISRKGVYRSFALDGKSYSENIEYNFVSGRLQKEIITYIGTKEEPIIIEHFYNEHGDKAHSKQLSGPVSKSPYSDYRYTYFYDKHNNWTQKIVSLGAMIITLEKREITYWE